MKKYQGKAQPKVVYKRNISCGIILLFFSLIILIPNYINGKIYDFDTFALIACFSCGIIGFLCLIWCLYCYETFYITDNEIVVKNCFKKLKTIKKDDIKNIFIARIEIGRSVQGSCNWQYIWISTQSEPKNKYTRYTKYLNAKYRKEITLDFSCKNEDIINKWTENKFDLYEQ